MSGGPEGKRAFNPPSVAELAPAFPQLEILELIGSGGMGAVYKARQKELDRIVALKILPPGIGDDPAFAERFAREAKALAKLNHPGIVTIYEFGRADGLYFFLMEYVDGVNLRQAAPRAAGSRRARRWPSCRRFATRCNSRTTRASSTATSSRRTFCWTAGAA